MESDVQTYLDENRYTYDYGSMEDNAIRRVVAMLRVYPLDYVVKVLKRVVTSYEASQQAIFNHVIRLAEKREDMTQDTDTIRDPRLRYLKEKPTYYIDRFAGHPYIYRKTEHSRPVTILSGDESALKACLPILRDKAEKHFAGKE